MKSLRARLLVWNLVVLVVVLAGGGFALDRSNRAVLRDEVDRALRARLLALGDLLNEPYEAQGEAALRAAGKEPLEVDGALERAFAGEFGPKSDNAYQVWWSRTGEVFKSPAIATTGFERPSSFSEEPNFLDLRTADGAAWRAIGVALPAPEGGTIDVLLAEHAAPFEQRLQEERKALLLVGSIAIGVALLFSALALRVAIGPLDRLTARLAAVEPPDFGGSLPEAGVPTEVALYSRRFNELLERWRDAFARERRFCDAVAHELRTPVAELRTTSEVALGDTDDRAGLETALRDAHDVALHMGRLVESLLSLHRGQADGAAANVEVRLAPLLRPLLDRAKADGVARQLRIDAEIPDDARLVSDPDLVLAIAKNVCGNAIEHAQTGSTIRVKWERSGGGFILCWRNTPELPLTDADVARFSEPFWRRDPARGGAHLGLGWTVAEAMATAVNTTLKARLEAGDVLVEWAGS